MQTRFRQYPKYRNSGWSDTRGKQADNMRALEHKGYKVDLRQGAGPGCRYTGVSHRRNQSDNHKHRKTQEAKASNRP